ncbi:MAG: sodium:proton antiporter NhaD [Muribaculaceae bacterium]|nr:sodium:proton antiporter NhaD [Muribaculaceae bacterium]MDE6118915.1 sodium:proton antiporter NhaD [Muribaculaceae bacterium]MDE6316023.1 sodium:proton antiporter NhaD [Muribaculaceae bacterium]
MLIPLLIVFVIGYLCIAFEHPLRVDKTATALLLGMVMWCMYALGSAEIVPIAAPESFQRFLADNPSLAGLPLAQQTMAYVLDVDIIAQMGEITQTLFFLLGAMTIVELIDVHGGFRIITERIVTRRKRRLLWIISFTTFIMSAILDNLTTTIVMVMLLRKLIAHQKERWLYVGAIVIAANSGGAWSPIGDVTTIMLWVKGNVTAQSLLGYVLLPSLVSMVVPVWFISRRLHGELPQALPFAAPDLSISRSEQNAMFFLGVGGLIFVPLFKTITHLPPFIGILLVLGVLWTFTEIFYNSKKMLEKARQHRIPKVIARVDMPSILFFLGILMAVAVLQVSGVLAYIASAFDEHIHDVYIIASLLGVLSSIVDNVPLVAAAIGMYPVADPAAVGYAANFVIDGTFWELLSYCAGVGGSILIIGSASGVIAMGLERISFGWYLRNFSWLALLGYLAGVVVYVIEKIAVC